MPCRAYDVTKPIFGTVSGGLWINGSYVGLDREKRILGCRSAWLLRIRLMIERSIPIIGLVGT